MVASGQRRQALEHPTAAALMHRRGERSTQTAVPERARILSSRTMSFDPIVNTPKPVAPLPWTLEALACFRHRLRLENRRMGKAS